MLPDVRRAIDQAVTRLGKAEFVPDPSITPSIGRIASIVGSVQKRHGAILKRALHSALQSSPELEVWTEPAFCVQPAADQACDLRRPREYWQGVVIPYLPGRAIRVDLLAYHRRTRALAAYQLKRGNGRHDAGKMRQVVRDLICVQTLLRSYGAARGLTVRECSAFMVSYYGREEQAGEWTLDRTQLDQHFGFPVLAEIEEANEYYRSEVEAICIEPLRESLFGRDIVFSPKADSPILPPTRGAAVVQRRPPSIPS